MKRTIVILLCAAALVFLVASCYTAHKCPAYGHYSEVIK